MKNITLTNSDKFALVDDDNYNYLVSLGKWHVRFDKHEIPRAIMSNSYLGGHAYLHRVIMKAHGFHSKVDHINRDIFDNQKHNLRICSQGHNTRNSGPIRKSKTGYKGVSFDKRYNSFYARIDSELCGKNLYLGVFITAEEAARAYDKKALELYGEYAYLNFPAIKQ